MPTHSALPEHIAAKFGAAENGCWEWHGARDKYGYGQAWWNGGRVKAHRLVYELLVADIADGLQIDHLCRNRCCVNPQHLEPVTRRVNIQRGESPAGQHSRATHCPQGHPYHGDNLYVRPSNNGRECRTCRRAKTAGRRRVTPIVDCAFCGEGFEQSRSDKRFCSKGCAWLSWAQRNQTHPTRAGE